MKISALSILYVLLNIQLPSPQLLQRCMSTVSLLRLSDILSNDTVLPTFGICMGSQLVGLSLGCKLFKLKYGNRGHNQPCTHVETKRCFITSQNHGFALDTSTLDAGVC